VDICYGYGYRGDVKASGNSTEGCVYCREVECESKRIAREDLAGLRYASFSFNRVPTKYCGTASMVRN
jgi:hypothetical protein